MHAYQRTRAGISRVRLAFRRLLKAAFHDSCDLLIALGRGLSLRCGFYSQLKRLGKTLGLIIVVPGSAQMAQASCSRGRCSIEKKPLIFASACVDAASSGGWKYNGGIKELNLLVKLLRNHRYEAYMVTYDGSYEPWLIEHQPHISTTEFRELVRSKSNIRCVTSWAKAYAFIDEAPGLYFWDMELTYTEHEHFPDLCRLYKHKMRNVAAISRIIQAWHMAHFQTHCTVIPNLLDETRWMPDTLHQEYSRVGYMYEGPHTEGYLQVVEEAVKASGVKIEFHPIRGPEAEVLAGMQSCKVFLSMNIGKDPLWGEGCPRTLIEALSAGCVPIAFETIGNREIIQNNYNGVFVPRYRPDLMANSLINLYKIPGEIERLRENAQSIIRCCHTLESRWPAVRYFLELPAN